MKTKTVKELAEELGVSKETIRRCVATLPPHCYHVGTNNQKIINADGINKIRSKISKKVAPNKQKQSDNQQQLVLAFENQINLLKTQLEEKDRQIARLHTMLDQEQQLTLLANQKIEHLQIEINALEEIPKKEKKSLWKFFR